MPAQIRKTTASTPAESPFSDWPRLGSSLINLLRAATPRSIGPPPVCSLSSFRRRARRLGRGGLDAQDGKQLHRQRKDDGGALLGPEFNQRLQIAERDGGRLALDNRRRFGQLGGSLELAVRGDDLGSPLAFGLGLPRHGPLHLLGQVHLLDLDFGHFDAPLLRVLVQNRLQPGVELFALRKQVIEFDLAQDRPQCRLCQLLDLIAKILKLHDGLLRVHDAVENDGVHFHRNVVPRDDVLRRHIPGYDTERNLHDLVNGPEDQDDARSFVLTQDPPQAEDHRALILPQDVQALTIHMNRINTATATKGMLSSSLRYLGSSRTKSSVGRGRKRMSKCLPRRQGGETGSLLSRTV